jgi:ASC-1-like (ASCH) protein
MRVMCVKKPILRAIRAGTKRLEVLLANEKTKKIARGDFIRYESGRKFCLAEVIEVREYTSFKQMLKHEPAESIAPDKPSPTGALNILRSIYPKEKEALGVYVLELKVVQQ